jgi:hypothetical protein
LIDRGRSGSGRQATMRQGVIPEKGGNASGGQSRQALGFPAAPLGWASETERSSERSSVSMTSLHQEGCSSISNTLDRGSLCIYPFCSRGKAAARRTSRLVLSSPPKQKCTVIPFPSEKVCLHRTGALRIDKTSTVHNVLTFNVLTFIR